MPTSSSRTRTRSPKGAAARIVQGALALILVSLPVHGEGPPAGWTVELGVDRAGRYLFRGVDLLGGGSVVAPRLSAARSGWTLYYDGAYGDLPGSGRYAEADFGADYKWSLGRAALTAGTVTYRYNRVAEEQLAIFDSSEVYASLAFDLPLSPTLSYARDLDSIDGGYGTIGLGQTIPLGERASLALSATAGFDFGYNNPDVPDGTLDDLLLAADLPVRIGDHLALHAGIQRSFAEEALDDLVAADPTQAAFYGDRSVVTFGATLSF